MCQAQEQVEAELEQQYLQEEMDAMNCEESQDSKKEVGLQKIEYKKMVARIKLKVETALEEQQLELQQVLDYLEDTRASQAKIINLLS